jgi:hypothetical protein
MHKNGQRNTMIVIMLASMFFQQLDAIVGLSKNDPFPLFSTQYPYDYLQKAARLCYREIPWAPDMGHTFSLSITGFLQTAVRGKSILGESTFTPNEDETVGGKTTITELGDLTGRSSMIALMYGKTPAGKPFPLSLVSARAGIFGDLPQPLPEFLNDGSYIDPNQNFGFFSFPLKYRKRGFAFEMILGWRDIGITCKGRFSNIQQTSTGQSNTGFINKTPKDSSGNFINWTGSQGTISGENVENFLMDQLETIMLELKQDIEQFVTSSFEEIVVSAYFRHAFNANISKNKEWTEFCIIPFVEVAGILSPGQTRNFLEQFSLNFGNNRHHAVAVHGGIDLDFMYTITVGFDGGMTWFASHDFDNVPVPTSEYQSTIFPFTTAVSIKPGLSTYLSAHMNALYFIDKLSGYIEYIIIEHREDKYTLKVPDDAFMPKVLQETSSFKVKLLNVGFNYDLVPWFSIGVAVQIPISQRNAYRSTNALFSAQILF